MFIELRSAKEWWKTSIIVLAKLQWRYNWGVKEVGVPDHSKKLKALLIISWNVILKNCKYLCSRPRVHAKIDAILLVLVSCPFWYSLKCRVTVPCAASASNVFASDDNCRNFCGESLSENPVVIKKKHNWLCHYQYRRHQTQRTKSCISKIVEASIIAFKNVWDQPEVNLLKTAEI